MAVKKRYIDNSQTYHISYCTSFMENDEQKRSIYPIVNLLQKSHIQNNVLLR